MPFDAEAAADAYRAEEAVPEPSGLGAAGKGENDGEEYEFLRAPTLEWGAEEPPSAAASSSSSPSPPKELEEAKRALPQYVQELLETRGHNSDEVPGDSQLDSQVDMPLAPPNSVEAEKSENNQPPEDEPEIQNERVPEHVPQDEQNQASGDERENMRCLGMSRSRHRWHRCGGCQD